MPRPSAALFYASDGFDTSRPRLMGRHAAGEGFLRALATHSGFDPLVALVRGEAEAGAFRRQVEAMRPGTRTAVIPEAQFGALSQLGALLLPGPDLSAAAWRRRRVGEANAFSLIGITHTIASAGPMESIQDALVAPVQPWDALICTSRAVRAAALRLLRNRAAYLRRRLGATRLEGPELPVIPLGVDCAAATPDPARRAAWRQRLRIAEGDVAVLFHGRLSFHAKAHPAPLFLALGRAAAAAPAGARVHLILSGWFSDEFQKRVFTEGAAAMAPGVALHLLDGRQADVRAGIRDAADIATLLSDNIQESFGLAPIEALAAGLPVVGTDWDGLRDTIGHGVTGFRVPTLMAGPLVDLADRHDAGLDSYDEYIAGVAQFTAVDVGAAEAAFAALIADAGRRRGMGEAARRDALARFDWRVVIGQYLQLFDHLAARRRDGRAERAPPLRGEERVPHRPDPAGTFADFPTRRLLPETRLALAPGADAARLRQVLALPGSMPRRDAMPPAEALEGVLARLAEGPCTAAVLVAELPPVPAMRLHRALAWMVKLDLLRPEDAGLGGGLPD